MNFFLDTMNKIYFFITIFEKNRKYNFDVKTISFSKIYSINYVYTNLEKLKHEY